MHLFSRRQFLAIAAAGRIAPPEWKLYPDPATELQVVRLTDPAFAGGMSAPHLRQFTRRGEALIYWSERYAADSPGRQAFVLDLKQGDSRQLTQAAALDPATLSFSPGDRTFFFFDGPALMESPLVNARPQPIYTAPADAVRTGFTLGADGAALFSERKNGKSRIVSVLRRQSRTISTAVANVDDEVANLMARPRHPQLLYRSGGQYWLLNTDGSGKRPLKTAPGESTGALWIPSGRTFTYLHIPDDPKELVTLREHAPDDGSERLLAKTSQFISASPNADASVFTGASRSRASAYVLILLRVARRELTVCEHRASDPAMVQPVFAPDSQSVLFVSDRHGKSALYQVHVNRFVEETNAEPEIP